MTTARTRIELTDPTGDTALFVPAGTLLTLTEATEGLLGTYDGWVFPVDATEVEPMTTAVIRRETRMETLCDAALLCEICQERPWTQTARFCHALICAGCAEGEPEPEEE